MNLFHRTNKGSGAQENGVPRAREIPQGVRASGTHERGDPPGGAARSGADQSRGRRVSLDEIIDAYEEHVATIIANKRMRDHADEIEAEVFFDVNKILVKDGLPVDPRALITTITLRRISDHQRVLVRERAHMRAVDADSPPDSQPDLDELLDQKRAVEAVFAEMSPEDAALVREYDFVGVRSEIALSSTVRSRVRRARGRFIAALNRLFGNDKGDGR